MEIVRNLVTWGYMSVPWPSIVMREVIRSTLSATLLRRTCMSCLGTFERLNHGKSK